MMPREPTVHHLCMVATLIGLPFRTQGCVLAACTSGLRSSVGSFMVCPSGGCPAWCESLASVLNIGSGRVGCRANVRTTSLVYLRVCPWFVDRVTSSPCHLLMP